MLSNFFWNMPDVQANYSAIKLYCIGTWHLPFLPQRTGFRFWEPGSTSSLPPPLLPVLGPGTTPSHHPCTLGLDPGSLGLPTPHLTTTGVSPGALCGPCTLGWVSDLVCQGVVPLPHHQIAKLVGSLVGSMTWHCRLDLACRPGIKHSWSKDLLLLSVKSVPKLPLILWGLGTALKLNIELQGIKPEVPNI